MGAYVESRELRVDNSAAITLASEEGGSWRTRHLKVRAGALRQRIQEGWIAISYCPGDLQLADGLTKILPAKRMEALMAAWGLKHHQGGDQHPDLPEEEDQGGSLRQLQAPARSRQQQDITSTPAGTQALGCCLGLVVALQNLATVMGRREDPEDPMPLAVDSSLELYGVVVMLMICVVALWEGGRHCLRRADSIRMRSLQAEQRLTKREMRRLNLLLQQEPKTLSDDDREMLTALADKAGVDLSKILARSVSTSTSYTDMRGEVEPPLHSPPLHPPPAAASAADEEYLRRERAQLEVRESGSMRPRPARDLYDPPIEPAVLASEVLGGRYGTTRDVGVQVQTLQEIPRGCFYNPLWNMHSRDERL